LPRFNRGEDIRGKLITMTDKSLTIEQPVGPLGGESKRMVLKLGEKCSLVYHNVGPGGAKRVAGQHAQVWFEKGSKETAAEVALSGEVRERWTTIRGKVSASPRTVRRSHWSSRRPFAERIRSGRDETHSSDPYRLHERRPGGSDADRWVYGPDAAL
jgi:hypothetical protein